MVDGEPTVTTGEKGDLQSIEVVQTERVDLFTMMKQSFYPENLQITSPPSEGEKVDTKSTD